MEYDPNATAAYLAGKVDEYVKYQGRDTITSNANRDKYARYARIPDGKACDFCKMLGSRGFVYRSESRAGGGMSHGSKYDSYHPWCNCQIAVTFEPSLDYYYKNGVKVVRGYGGSDAKVVRAGRDGSEKMRDVDIDELFDEYLKMGRSFKSQGHYRRYTDQFRLTDEQFEDAMKALDDAKTLDELYKEGARIVEDWKAGADGRPLDDFQWKKMSERAKELEKQFKSKPSEEPLGRNLGERRGQIDAGSGIVDEKDMEKFNRMALDSLMEETGYGELDARKLQSSLQEWLGGDYEAFSRGDRAGDVGIIDAGLRRMGAYDSDIFRGMHFSTNSTSDMDAFREFETIEPGSKIEMRSVSSWTSNRGIADGYANIGSDESKSVVLKCSSNETAVGVQHVSKWRTTEAEVLAPSDAEWEVVGVREVNMYDYEKQKLEEGDMSPIARKIATRQLQEREEELKRQSFIEIEVVEIG